MRIALDTNILAYAEGVNGFAAKQKAAALIQKLSREDTFIPIQALGELFHVLSRKAGRSPERARLAISNWQDTFETVETSPAVFGSALELASRHQFTIWDAVILSAASAASCRLLLSEDLQSEFTWSGVTVANPFTSTKSHLLAELFGE